MTTLPELKKLRDKWLKTQSLANAMIAVIDMEIMTFKPSKIKKATEEENDRFEKFWEYYHEQAGTAKEKKSDCRKHWDKLKLAEQRLAWKGVKPYVSFAQSQDRYILTARSYVSGRTWEDDYTDPNYNPDNVSQL